MDGIDAAIKTAGVIWNRAESFVWGGSDYVRPNRDMKTLGVAIVAGLIILSGAVVERGDGSKADGVSGG